MIILPSSLAEAVLHGVAAGVARVDDGQILFATPLLESMFGYTTRGALTNGITVDELAPHTVRGRHTQHRADYAANPSTRPMGVGLNTYGQRFDGSTFPIAVSLYSEVISGIVCVVFSVMDISGWGGLLQTMSSPSDDPSQITRMELKSTQNKLPPT